MKLTLKQIVKIIEDHGFTVERFDGKYLYISGIYPDAIEMVSVTTQWRGSSTPQVRPTI